MWSSVEVILDRFEDQYEPKIIGARDVGDRAYNVHNGASDFEVRAICASPPTQYARFDPPSAEYHLQDSDVDLDVWDVRTFCRRLADSDPRALEFCRSNIVYRESDVWQTDCAETVQQLPPDPVELYHYYRGRAERWFYHTVCDFLVDKDTGERLYSVDSVIGGEYTVTALNDVPSRDRIRQTQLDWLNLEEPNPRKALRRELYTIRNVLCARYVAAENECPPLDASMLLRYCESDLTPMTHDQDSINKATLEHWAKYLRRLINRHGDRIHSMAEERVREPLTERMLPPSKLDEQRFAENGPDTLVLDQFLGEVDDQVFGADSKSQMLG